MDFVTSQEMVAERLGLDLSVSEQATKVKRWINVFQQTLTGFMDWSWLEDRTVLEAVPDITTGTITATNNSTTITFTSAPSVSVAGYFIQSQDSDDWYKISSHTAASTSATLENQYVQTGGSGLTYTLRKVNYSLPSSVDRIVSVKQYVSPRTLVGTLTRHFDRAMPDLDSTGSTEWYYLWGQDSSGNWLFTPYPIPNQRFIWEIRFYKKASNMTSDSEVSIVPVKWHQILVEGASMLGAPYVGDPQIMKDSKAMVSDLLTAMIEEDGQSRDESSVRRSVDAMGPDLVSPVLPSHYGRQIDE